MEAFTNPVVDMGSDSYPGLRDIPAYFSYRHRSRGRDFDVFEIALSRYPRFGETHDRKYVVAGIVARVQVTRTPNVGAKAFLTAVNELLDNVAMLCAMQRGLEYTVERRLRVPDLQEKTKLKHLSQPTRSPTPNPYRSK